MADTGFAARDLYADLVKGVFGTFSFPESKWKDIIYVPDIGRTFFQDHKMDAAPFTRTGIEKLCLLYKSALQDDMAIASGLVTTRLAAVIKKRAFVNLSFLVYYDDDTENLRKAKYSYWLILLDKLTAAAAEKEQISYSDMLFLQDEVMKIEARIKALAADTYTFELIDAPVREQRRIKREKAVQIAREVFSGAGESSDHPDHGSMDSSDDTGFDYDEYKTTVNENIRLLSEHQKGICLFFLNCSITNVTSFIEKFPRYSQLQIKSVRTCRAYPVWEDMLQSSDDIIPFEEWQRKMENNGICPTLETKLICSGFDIEGVKEGMDQGISYICIGSSNEYVRIKQYIDSVALFLVVPDKIEQVIYEMESRGYYAEVAKDRLESLRDCIDFMLANDGFVIRWQEGQGRETLSYYAGMIDSIISMNPLTKQLNITFLQKYRDTIEKITRT